MGIFSRMRFEAEIKKNPYKLIDTWLTDFPRMIGQYVRTYQPMINVTAAEVMIFLYDIFDYGCIEKGLTGYSDKAFSATWEYYWNAFKDIGGYSDPDIEEGFDIHLAAYAAIRKQEGFIQNEYLPRVMDYQSTILSVFAEKGTISKNNTPQCENDPMQMHMELPGFLSNHAILNALMNGYMDNDNLAGYIKTVRYYVDYCYSIKMQY